MAAPGRRGGPRAHEILRGRWGIQGATQLCRALPDMGAHRALGRLGITGPDGLDDPLVLLEDPAQALTVAERERYQALVGTRNWFTKSSKCRWRTGLPEPRRTPS